MTTPNTRRRYELDEMGNITSTRFGENTFAVLRSTYDEAGRPLTVKKLGGVQDEFVYDENGNVIDRPGLHQWELRRTAHLHPARPGRQHYEERRNPQLHLRSSLR